MPTKHPVNFFKTRMNPSWADVSFPTKSALPPSLAVALVKNVIAMDGMYAGNAGAIARPVFEGLKKAYRVFCLYRGNLIV